MNRHVKVLSLLLALQLVVLGGVMVWQQRATSTPATMLLTADRAKVDGLVIVDDKGATLKLRKAGSGWTLPDAEGLPADNDKVAQLLDKLLAASAPWPVATSAESAKRFEVSPEKFQREIKLMDHDQVVGDLYLGTSPGFKKVHARRADSDAVYAIAFANYEATARADDWLDKSLLKPSGDVTALARPGHWRLKRDGEAWTLDDLTGDEKIKQDVVTDLVNKIANLRVMGVAVAPAETSEPALELTASTPNGEFDYLFYQPQPKGDFIVTRSGQDGAFKLAAYIAEPLVKDRSDLIASPEATAVAASVNASHAGDTKSSDAPKRSPKPAAG
jgi:Domain of unknown function (DUF4340)